MNIMFVRIPGYSFSPYSLQLMEKKTHVFSGCAYALIGIRRPVWMPRMKHQWLNGHWLVFGFCTLGFGSFGEHFCIGVMADSGLLAFWHRTYARSSHEIVVDGVPTICMYQILLPIRQVTRSANSHSNYATCVAQCRQISRGISGTITTSNL